MQVIFGRETAEQIRERYTVLELETFHAHGKEIPAFCVIPNEKIPINDLARLEELTALHQDFIDSFNAENYENCKNLYFQLHGQWKGELDSFYETIFNKVNSRTT